MNPNIVREVNLVKIIGNFKKGFYNILLNFSYVTKLIGIIYNKIY
ncbi:hypothetical protein BGAPBR_E0016 (plasmid) [Borreliella garinii PBr]|uniref:Uncharacterized protein n=1 Tax=Borreliella garinii PBr TaxID=498743 RepID=B8F0J6_BORGR|nr:hypothetical protein [Borreliella garinii]ACL34437.1 hypothetical protein BGAPBR_E0016 [Borreliella garinii PBr]